MSLHSCNLTRTQWKHAERAGYVPKTVQAILECTHCLGAIGACVEHWHHPDKHYRLHGDCLVQWWETNERLRSDGWAVEWRARLAEVESLKRLYNERGYVLSKLEERLGMLRDAAERVLAGSEGLFDEMAAEEALREALAESRRPMGAYPEKANRTLAQALRDTADALAAAADPTAQEVDRGA